jgi:hypothetical protein
MEMAIAMFVTHGSSRIRAYCVLLKPIKIVLTLPLLQQPIHPLPQNAKIQAASKPKESR